MTTDTFPATAALCAAFPSIASVLEQFDGVDRVRAAASAVHEVLLAPESGASRFFAHQHGGAEFAPWSLLSDHFCRVCDELEQHTGSREITLGFHRQHDDRALAGAAAQLADGSA